MLTDIRWARKTVTLSWQSPTPQHSLWWRDWNSCQTHKPLTFDPSGLMLRLLGFISRWIARGKFELLYWLDYSHGVYCLNSLMWTRQCRERNIAITSPIYTTGAQHVGGISVPEIPWFVIDLKQNLKFTKAPLQTGNLKACHHISKKLYSKCNIKTLNRTENKLYTHPDC